MSLTTNPQFREESDHPVSLQAKASLERGRQVAGSRQSSLEQRPEVTRRLEGSRQTSRQVSLEVESGQAPVCGVGGPRVAGRRDWGPEASKVTLRQ